LRAAISLVALIVGGCALRRPIRQDYGIPRCPATASADVLAATALQCWFDARHGRWRILSHVSHYDALVVDVSAASLDDAGEIGERVVASVGDAFAEMLLYVRAESNAPAEDVRRISWTRADGFTTLDIPP
jgi:hypothetical protein